jgi:peptidoglycan/LPS O-acetylase OafA/YrhL
MNPLRATSVSCHHLVVEAAARSTGFSYIASLDGVRAAAVLMVVAFHARSQWFPGGYIGVDVFFVMSGYLITSILLREVERTGQISVRRFYLRRGLRLLPALTVLCVVVTVAFLVVPGVTDRSSTLVGALGAFTYTSSILLASGTSGLGWMVHTWSLSVEEYFYLFWPFVLVACMRRGQGFVRALMLSLTLLAIVYRVLASNVFHWSAERVAYAADTRAEQLFIGCALAVFLPTLRRIVPAWMVIGSGLLLLGFVILPPATSFELYFSHGGSTMIALLVALVIAGLVGRPAGLPARLLSTQPLVWVGQRSYGIYLWNLPIIAVVAAFEIGDNVQLVVKIILTFVIPAVSYRWVEMPFLRLKNRDRPTLAVPSSVSVEG